MQTPVVSPTRKTKFAIAALLVACLGVLLLTATPSAQAADIRSGERVVIDASTVIADDLYVTADEVVIDGTVKGDVYAFGSTVTINGNVERDVIAGGQEVFINGTIGDTLRAGGQTIVLGDKANIAHTALLAAFSIETKAGSTIGHDLVFGAYQALLGGTIQHDVVAGARGIEISGTVGRNVRVSVGSEREAGPSPTMFMPQMRTTIPNVPPGLTIEPTAKIGGDVVYESNAPVTVPSGAQVTGPVVQQTPVPDAYENRAPPTPEQIQAEQQQRTINSVLNVLRDFIVLLLIGLLAIWLLPKWIGALADFVQTKPLGSFGRGILMVVGYFVASVVLVIAIVMLVAMFLILTLNSLAGATVLVGTVLFGVLTVGYWLFVTYVAPIVVSFLIGKLLLGRMQAAWAQNRFVQFIIGLILLSLVLLIPLVDFFVGILVAIFALGALLLWLASRLVRGNAAVTPTAAV